MTISRENNFDLIRLIASLEVAIGHTSFHLQGPENNLFSNEYSFPFPGVFVFFVISGFLITASYERNKQYIRYLKNRILRIVPALWIAFILLFFVLWAFGFINRDTLSNHSFWGWVFGQITLFQFYTPDILRPFGVGCPNGSLWTIPVEFVFYLILPLLLILFKNRGGVNRTLLASFLLSLTINMLLSNYGNDSILCKLIHVSILPWLYVFLLGSLIYKNWDFCRKYLEGKAYIYVILYFLYVNFVTGPSYDVVNLKVLIANILLGLMVISLAYTRTNTAKFMHGFDISYGLYLYHMIVVNAFVQMGLVGKYTYAILALSISIVLASLSWMFVERKLLRLKNK